MWPTSSSRTTSYGLPSELGMFVVAPATSFHESLIPDSHPSAHPTNPTIGVIPLFNVAGEIDAPDLSTTRNRTAALQLWQNHHQQQQHHQQQVGNTTNYPKKGISFETGGPNSLPSASAATCQDCGNQSKKDCTHRRCRTCCRSRGFDCATHLKSTWVPAARRRERQIMAATAAGGGGASSGSTSGAKKPRLISSATTTSHTSNSNTVDTGSSHQDLGSLPGQVKAPAVFRCVRVTAVEGGEDQFAYQAVVKIGGHVFKGFLYDQGVDSREGFPNISDLHLGGSGSGGGGGGGGRNGVASFDPAEVYGGGLLGGSSFGNTAIN